MRLSTAICFLLALQSAASLGQTRETSVSKKTAEIVTKIAESNVLWQSRSEQLENFNKLKEIATTQELAEHTNHENGVVRCYSFWALAYRKGVDLFRIVKDHISDDSRVQFRSYDQYGTEFVGDFFISVVTPGLIDTTLSKLTDNEISALDSILLHTDNNLLARIDAIENAKQSNTNYLRIHELAERGNGCAIVNLAKYQRDEDVDLILSHREQGIDSLFTTYQAISCFPHSRFIPFLQQNQQAGMKSSKFQNEWRKLYEAIASYKSKHAAFLLALSFGPVTNDEVKEYHVGFSFNAARKFMDPVYCDLFWTFWEQYNIITPDVLYYLKNVDNGRTLELTINSLINTDMVYGAPNNLYTDSDYEETDELYRLMISISLENDHKASVPRISDMILGDNKRLAKLALVSISNRKDKAFVETLFTKIDNEDDVYVYLLAMQCLADYDDAGITKRLLKSIEFKKAKAKSWEAKEIEDFRTSNGI